MAGGAEFGERPSLPVLVLHSRFIAQRQNRPFRPLPHPHELGHRFGSSNWQGPSGFFGDLPRAALDPRLFGVGVDGHEAGRCVSLACPLDDYGPMKRGRNSLRILVGASGIEPPTPTMSRWCSTT